MSHRLTTARAHELGAELRRLRKRSGCSSVELGKKLGWAASTVTRMETGVRAISETNLAQFAATAGATPPQLKHLQAMWGEGRGLGYWLTDRFSSMLFHESTALSTVAYQPVVVPGMLPGWHTSPISRRTWPSRHAHLPLITQQLAGQGNSVAPGVVS